MWFLYHKWNAQRFFYVRQRIEEILRILQLEANTQALINQLSDSDDDLSKEMIDLHKQRLHTNLFSQEERELIKKHQNVLEQILKQG